MTKNTFICYDKNIINLDRVDAYEVYLGKKSVPFANLKKGMTVGIACDKFEIKDGLTKEDIKKINKNVDVNKLMESLYNKYLKFVDKIKNNDTKLDSILGGSLKDVYINRLENFKSTGYNEIIEEIDLVGYTIIDYSKEKINFRITINCFDYKLLNDKIVSGSNLIKLEEVFLLTYEKIGNKWLITNCDKVYEKKLSD